MVHGTDSHGAVPLADAIEALRSELQRAWDLASRHDLRFKPSPVELTLQVGVTRSGGGQGGLNWGIIQLGGELSRQSAVTQTLRMTLEPVFLDSAGKVRPADESLIDGLLEDPEASQGDSGGFLEAER